MQSWRGVLRHLDHALRENGADVVVLELEDSWLGRLFALKEWFVRTVIRRRYQRHREPMILRNYGRRTAALLARERVDVAISLKVFPIAQADTSVPLILYNDSTFGGLLNFYAEFSGMSARHIAQGEAMEYAAGQRASHSVYSSAWGADGAIRRYGVAPERVSVIEMGANLRVTHTRSDIEALIRTRRQRERWEFLWLGVEWERKRGDMAVQIMEELHRRGQQVHLTIAGVKPEYHRAVSVCVTSIAFLDAAGIAAQLAQTDFVVLPTQADCTPIVYNEANAYGVPVFSTDVGGIQTQIRPGVNGALLPLEAGVGEWADAIAQHLDGAAYPAFALAAYDEYCRRLNWDTAAKRLLALAHRLHAAQLPAQGSASLSRE